MTRNATRTMGAVLACLLGSQMWAAEKSEFTESETPFAVKTIKIQKAWLPGGTPALKDWKPMSQPDLAEKLKAAPKLEYERIAPPPQRINYGPKPFLCPNPDGKSWDIISEYRVAYNAEGQIYVHDLGTGKHKTMSFGVKKEDARPGEVIMTETKTDFHMKGSWYINKKLYFKVTAGHGGWFGSMFLVYDPKVNDFVSKTVPFEAKSVDFSASLADDGKIYGCRVNDWRNKFYFYIYDPDTYKTKILPAVPSEHIRLFDYFRTFIKKGDWGYVKYGNSPWHLIAYNFKTGKLRHLAESTKIKGHAGTMGIIETGDGVRGHIENPAWIDGMDKFDEKKQLFWLHDGKIYPRTNSTPPWSKKPIDLSRKREKNGNWARRCREFQKWPEGFWATVSEPPEIKEWSAAPDMYGNVKLQYRFPKPKEKKEDPKEWKTIEHKVYLYDAKVCRLDEVNKDILFGSDESYGQKIMYDLKNRRLTRFPSSAGTYCQGFHEGSIYVTGYPHTQIERYDLANLPEKGVERIGYIGKDNDMHMPFGGLISGADGRVYAAGSTAGRRRKGGGMSWYNPTTNEKGFVKGIDDQRVFWSTSASDGRYILLSSYGSKGARIWCWDTKLGKFIYEKEAPEGCHTTGPLEEVFPGLVIGCGVRGEGKDSHGVLYGLRASTGTYIWTKELPVTPPVAFSQIRRHSYTFRRGPDGYIWATLGKNLVRINPRTAEVIPVGSCRGENGYAFANDGVYSTGKGLMKVKGLKVKSIK